MCMGKMPVSSTSSLLLEMNVRSSKSARHISSLTSPSHLLFVVSMARLCTGVCGVAYTEQDCSPASVSSLLLSVSLPQWAPSSKVCRVPCPGSLLASFLLSLPSRFLSLSTFRFASFLSSLSPSLPSYHCFFLPLSLSLSFCLSFISLPPSLPPSSEDRDG